MLSPIRQKYGGLLYKNLEQEQHYTLTPSPNPLASSIGASGNLLEAGGGEKSALKSKINLTTANTPRGPNAFSPERDAQSPKAATMRGGSMTKRTNHKLTARGAAT